MVTRLTELPAGTIGFEATGEMTAEDYRTVLEPPLVEALEAGRDLRVLFVAGRDFEEADLKAVWADIRLGATAVFGHRKQWKRMALVTDIGWIRRASGALGGLAPGEYRVFAEAELEAAKEWVAA